MDRVFLFRTIANWPRPQAEWLVVFSAERLLPLGDMSDALTDDIGRNLQPDAIVFIVRDNVAADVADQLRALQVADWRITIGSTPVAVVGFTISGSAGPLHSISGESLPAGKLNFRAVCDAGLAHLFIARNGLVLPDESTHFVHPSGKHSMAFIRTSNLLVLGSEVAFIAMTLLGRLDNDLAYLCVDTSSISSVAYALIQLRLLFEPTYRPPLVNSFSSWEGIRGAYRFALPTKTLVLISATTSGKMARELERDKRIPRGRIIILFSLATEREDIELLCDLRQHPRYTELNTTEYRDGQCALCRSGSTAVQFVGDQFLADAAVHEPVEVVGKNLPASVKTFMASYRGRRALQMRQAGSESQAVNAYFVDMAMMAKSPTFEERLAAACRRHVPASLARIVHAGDDASAQLASKIHRDIGLASVPLPASPEELRELPEDSIDGGVLVVAACIGSGGKLQSISRDLRQPAGDNPRTYLIGVAKHTHLPRFQSLTNDLTYSSSGHKHVMHVIEPLTLPERSGRSAWDAELALVQALLEPSGEPPAREVLDRLYLRQEEIARLAVGSTTGFFWDGPDGRPLSLRRTFAFWDGDYDPAQISQGDVLHTIACVLETLRGGKLPKLRRTAFSHGFLAPSTFGRFNDGIIQAAFLRAAYPSELDYSGAAGASEEMARLLIGLVSDPLGRGEAVVEFLVAIACGRMKLKPEHLSACLGQWPSATPMMVTLKSVIDELAH